MRIAFRFGAHLAVTLALALATTTATRAALRGQTPPSQFFVSTAASTPAVKSISVERSGATSFYKPLYGLLGPRASIWLSQRWRLEPSARLELPWRTNSDGDQRLFTSYYNIDAGYYLSRTISMRTGLGLQWRWLQGSQGQATLPNGTATSTYYTPDVSQSAWLTGLDLGFSWQFARRWRASLDSTVWEPLSAGRQTVSLAIGVDYALF